MTTSYRLVVDYSPQKSSLLPGPLCTATPISLNTFRTVSADLPNLLVMASTVLPSSYISLVIRRSLSPGGGFLDVNPRGITTSHRHT